MRQRAYRFSTRLEWDLRPNRLARLLRDKAAASARILDLTESNPTRAGFIPEWSDVRSAMDNPAVAAYHPEARGLQSAREAVAAYYRSSGLEVAAEQIVLTASTSEAYSFLFKLLGDPGDEILVPQPSYPLFEFLVRLEKLEIRQYPLIWDGTWRMDLDAISDLMGERTRALVLVNPNNPTGAFLKRNELERLARICAGKRAALISDEVFHEFALDPGAERVSVASQAVGPLSFTLSGLSKVAGLPQMKLGWIVVSGPAADRRAALEGLELVADTYLSVGAPVQHGAARLLGLRAGFQTAVLERTRANLRWLREATASHVCAPLHVEGGWYVTLRIPGVFDEEAWALELLVREDVLVQPGYFYDFPFPCVVVSLLTPQDTFREGVRRMLGRPPA